MILRFTRYFFIISVLIITIFTLEYSTGHIQWKIGQKTALQEYRTAKMTILLLPLDSRPPCTQFVEQLAAIAGIKILLPPATLLDNYKTPADRVGLQQWLQTNIAQADAAIISIDMLIHGGLLASRQAQGSTQDQERAIDILIELHEKNPQIPLYVFNIIPRLLIADSEETIRFQKAMTQYSILKDQIALFENPHDVEKLEKIENQVPLELVRKYQSLYIQNRNLNFHLINLTKQGVFAGLVIGQDDSQLFGWPNSIKRTLKNYLSNLPEMNDKIFITRGTDELALTLLGHIATHSSNMQPHIYVAYSHQQAAQTVMPFMPNTVQKTISEKIDLLGGREVDDPNNADFILYVHIGNRKTKDIVLSTAAHQLNGFIEQGYKVALVDLTEDFYASETVLSLLLKQKADLTKLIGYAGWNTTSNSIGTAVTQAALFSQAATNSTSLPESCEIYKSNLEFLIARLLDDWYYQKDIQPDINQRLLLTGIDPYNLGSAYNKTDQHIRELMADKARLLFHQNLANRLIPISAAGANHYIAITDLQIIAHLPWSRTFEIYINPTLTVTYWQ
ncbi:MAG: hypothetical protein H6Q65_1937 [Firmicutes bacterium]|nr:hypothetical protein [Bacillota bacterium]